MIKKKYLWITIAVILFIAMPMSMIRSEPIGNTINPINEAPVADFTYSLIYLKVTFIDRSTDNSGSIVNWSWNLGEGNTSNAQNPVHTYAEFGEYNVTLNVTDSGGLSNEIFMMIEVMSDTTPFKPMLISPVDNSNDVESDAELSVYVYDPDGDPLTVIFYEYVDGVNDTIIGVYSGMSDKNAEMVWQSRNYAESYQWYAIVNDGSHYVDSDIWTFTVTTARLASSSNDIWGIGILLALVVAFIAIAEKIKTPLFYFLTGFISMSAAIYVGAIGLGGDFDHLMLIIFMLVMMVFFLRMGLRVRKDRKDEEEA